MGPVGDYDYVFDIDGDGSADFFDGPLGARPAVPGFEPLGEPRPGLVTKKRNEIGKYLQKNLKLLPHTKNIRAT